MSVEALTSSAFLHAADMLRQGRLESGQAARSAVQELLGSLVRTEDVPSQPWRRARFHDNGFLKVLLVDVDEWPEREFLGCRLVLHIWDESSATGQPENVHNHRWPFWSVLLTGALTWEHYEERYAAGGEEAYQRFAYGSPGTGASYSMAPSGCVNLTRRFSATVTAGSTVAMDPDELHRVARHGQAAAATLLLQGRPCRDRTSVYVPREAATRLNAGSDGGPVSRAVVFASRENVLRSVQNLGLSVSA